MAKEQKKDNNDGMFKPDSTVCKQLGKSLTEVLFSPTHVNVYALKPKITPDSTDIIMTENHVRDSLICRLDDKQTAILQYVLLASDANYHNDSLVVRSPYNPVLEFEFCKKKLRAHVILSPLNKSWRIIYDGKEQFYHNYKHADIIEKYCMYFVKQIRKPVEYEKD